MIDLQQERRTDTILPFKATATIELQIEQLQPNPRHHRRRGSETDLADLADSLRQHGLLHSLCVRPLDTDHYEIIAGERRWRAAQLAGITSLSCHIFEIDEDQAFVLALVENIHRADLNPIERAKAYQNFLNTFSLTQSEAAQRLGEDRSVVANYLRLLDLPDEIKQMLIAGQLSMSVSIRIAVFRQDGTGRFSRQQRVSSAMNGSFVITA